MAETEIEPTDRLERLEKIQEVRDLLDFLVDNPEIPIPYFGMINSFVYDEVEVDTAARIMAPCDKDVSGSYFSLNRKFGSLEFSVNFAREEVCERIVVGTKEVPAHMIEARTEEVVEWKCPDGILRQA